MSFILAGFVLLLALFTGIALDGFSVGKCRRQPQAQDATENGGRARQIDAGLFGVNI